MWGDQLLAILAEDVLLEQPGSTIIGDVKASQGLFDRITTLGGKPLMWKTGHSLIKNKMKEVNAPLAGEMSGHIFLVIGTLVLMMQSMLQFGSSMLLIDRGKNYQPFDLPCQV